MLTLLLRIVQTVEKEHLGIAYGLTGSLLAGSAALTNTLVGYLIDTMHSYVAMLMMFFGFHVAALALSVVWNVLDYMRFDGMINAPSKGFDSNEQLSETVTPRARPQVARDTQLYGTL